MMRQPYLGFILALLVVAPVLGGCAGHMPVPGGADTVNQSFYTTRGDLLNRLNQIIPGMNEQTVFSVLGHDKGELQQMERDQIVNALYGTSSVEFKDGAPNHQDSSAFFQSLYGYRLNYKIVERALGFSSPIRIRTDESGFDYAVTLVFRENVLYAPPIVSGGIVNRSSSRTFFDYLNPGTILDHSL